MKPMTRKIQSRYRTISIFYRTTIDKNNYLFRCISITTITIYAKRQKTKQKNMEDKSMKWNEITTWK